MTAFDTWGFPATGAPTNRTMPDRLSDIVNVKDWGAVGNNSHDDTSNINDAINYCITRGGGKVFFPAGQYKVTAAGGIVVGHDAINVGVQLIGSGTNATSINGNLGGWTISKGGKANDCLEMVADMTVANNSFAGSSGAIQITRPNAICRNIVGAGWFFIDASNCTGAFIASAFPGASGASNVNGSADPTNHGFAKSGTIAFQTGDKNTLIDCRVQGYELAYMVTGIGVTMVGCTAEVNTIGIRLGSAGVVAKGCAVLGFQAERTAIGMEMYNCQACYITGMNLEGNSSPADNAACTVAWNAGTQKVEVTTSGGHNLLASPVVLNMNIPSQWLPSGDPYVKVTTVNSTVFTYDLSVDPTGTSSGSPTWNYPQQYGLRLRKASECVIAHYIGSNRPAQASIDLDYGPCIRSLSDQANAQLRNVVFETVHATQGWAPSTTSVRNLAGCRFLHCTGVANANWILTTVPIPVLTFADLPGQTGVFQTGPLEGQTYNISNGDNSTFGGTQAGGGSGHYLVRYDGAHWVRIG